jgi:hypothetical protein
VTTAASTAVDLTAGAQEKLRAEAQLTAAGIKDGLTPAAAALQAQMSSLGLAAAAAADALAKAKVNSEIKFDTATAFLTPDDLQIAQKLKGIYGTAVPAALNSTEAAGLRAADALRSISNLGQTTLSGFGTDFTSAIRSGSTAFQSLESAGVSALGKISDKLMTMATDKLWASAFGGTSGSGLLGLLGIGGGSGAAAQSASAATLSGKTGGAFFGPGFAVGTDSAPGGLARVNEEGGEIINLPRGSQVIPHDVSMAMASGGSVSAPVTIHIDATGADPAGLARVQAQLAQLQATLPGTIVSTVKKARTGRQL